ncbi:MAG: L-lactate dehydrogenase [Negativicutes bacterium]|nr:L-lactate dehydrogenase [Negativicutes bacterium]
MGTRQWKARKVAIVGAGAVGSTFAYALAQSGVAEDIAIIDSNQDLVKGQVLDLAHGLSFFPAIHIHEGNPNDYSDANVIVVTAGAKQQPGESRLGLLDRNVAIIKKIARDIAAQQSRAVILVVSNPVDILTYAMQKELDWAPGQVIGSGTVLDSARFRYLLGIYLGVDSHSIHGYILGEHGDSEFAAWSMTHVGGSLIEQYCMSGNKRDDWEAQRQRIVDEVKNSAYHIINYKGATYFAIGLALTQIVTAVLRNQRSVLSISTLLTGEYGLKDVCLSVPCVVSQKGAERIIEGEITPDEMNTLSGSAAVLQKTLADLNKVEP